MFQVHAEEDILSKIWNAEDTKLVEKCVSNINQSANEKLGAAERLYQTSMCYFCAGCDFENDQGVIFSGRSIHSGNELPNSQSYEIAYKLMNQAVELGSVKAFYGLAAIQFVSETGQGKISKTELSAEKTEEYRQKALQNDFSEEKLNSDLEALVQSIHYKQHEQDYSRSIHVNLLNAARFGHLSSQFALGEIYSRGIGVAPDNIEAYAWTAAAVAQNPPFGSTRRDKLGENLDYMELNEADLLAETYMKEHTDIFDRASVTVMR